MDGRCKAMADLIERKLHVAIARFEASNFAGIKRLLFSGEFSSVLYAHLGRGGLLAGAGDAMFFAHVCLGAHFNQP